METWQTKVVALSIMLVATLLFGLLPIQFIRVIRRRTGRFSRSRLEFILSLLNCFAGGVFFGTTFLHLLPEVREDVEKMLQQYSVDTNFAVSEFIVSGGFFIIMFIENLVMVAQHHSGNNRDGFESVESSVSCDKDHAEQEPIANSQRTRRSYGSIRATGHTEGTTNPCYQEEESKPVQFHKSQEDNFEVSVDAAVKKHEDTTSKKGGKHDHSLSSTPQPSHSGHHHHHHDHHQVKEIGDGQDAAEGSQQCLHPPVLVEKGDCVHIIHPSHHQHHHMEPKQLASLRSFLLLLALSTHTVFEGLAIGLQPTNQDVWNLFIAIIVHKTVIAFSMGIQFAENLKTYKNAIIFIVLFSIMSPVGVAIGTGIFELQGPGDISLVVSVVLQGVAAGTFLYVTFFEVLNQEVGQDHSVLKVFFVLIGFGAMVLLNLFNGEPED